MTLSKLLLSVAVATSFLIGSSGGALASMKSADFHSTLKMSVPQSSPLAVQSLLLNSDDKAVSLQSVGLRERKALGAFLVLGTAAIIASQMNRRRHYNNYSYRGYNRGSSARRCNKWLRRCDRGIRRACRKYYNRCERYSDYD